MIACNIHDARSGDPAMIAGYLGSSDAFDDAIVGFAVRLRRSDAARLRGIGEGRPDCCQDGITAAARFDFPRPPDNMVIAGQAKPRHESRTRPPNDAEALLSSQP